MPTVYEKATPRNDGAEVLEIIASVIKEHHPELATAGVTVACLLASAEKDDFGNPLDHAVKLHGDPAYAVIRAVPYKQRVAGLPDAEITLDADKWKELSEARRRALIDHELFHLIVRYTESGGVDTDDLGRPKLKLRHHDLIVGGFEEMLKRHGADAIEAEHIKDVQDKAGQYLMAFMGAA